MFAPSVKSFVSPSFFKESLSSTLITHKKNLITISLVFISFALYYALKPHFFKERKVKIFGHKKMEVNKTEGKALETLGLVAEKKEGVEKFPQVDSKIPEKALGTLGLGEGEKKEIEKFPVIQALHQVDSKIDEEAFKKYLFLNKNITENHKVLFKHTLCQATFPSTPINYRIFTSDQKPFEDILKKPIDDKHQSVVSSSSNWFDYQDENQFYIDFAHSTSFGGGYRSQGCVQEERMFAEFPVLALLDFITQNGIHPCVESYYIDKDKKKRKYPPHAQPSPFIIESIHRQFDISKTPYASAFKKANSKTIVDGIVKIDKSIPVNVIGLAAVDFGNVKNPEYQMKDLKYHFEAAYLGNIGAKMIAKEKKWKKPVIHTAPWGCGAFLNSEKMMIAIQYLAAKAADVDLVFHGIDNPMNPHYTQKDIDQIVGWIDRLIKMKTIPLDILEAFLQKNSWDPAWKPKSKK